MKIYLLFFLVSLSLFSVPLHAETRDSFETQIEWTLSLGADGGITDLSPLDANFLPAVRKQLEPVVRTWHFTPGKVTGQAAPTETTLRVGVALDATNASQYRGHITFATTGPAYRHRVMPEYPETAQHFRHEGAVMLWIEYDAEGQVTSARDVPKMGTARIDPALTNAAIEAVKQWTFRPEAVAGHGVASRALVPVCFKMREEPCHWNRPEGTKPIHPGEPIGLASVVELDMGSANQMP